MTKGLFGANWMFGMMFGAGMTVAMEYFGLTDPQWFSVAAFAFFTPIFGYMAYVESKEGNSGQGGVHLDASEFEDVQINCDGEFVGTVTEDELYQVAKGGQNEQ